MIELTASAITLSTAGLTAQEAADAVKALAEVGISHERLTLTQSIATAVVADQPQQLAPEGVGATFLGQPVEWYARPQWEHVDDMAQCDYEVPTGLGGEPCVLPAFHEVPPLGIKHATASAFPDSPEPEWPAKDFDWNRAASLQGAAPCDDEHEDEGHGGTVTCVLPMGHQRHRTADGAPVNLHTDHPEGSRAPEAYVWF